jgi:hypothetical protein
VEPGLSSADVAAAAAVRPSGRREIASRAGCVKPCPRFNQGIGPIAESVGSRRCLLSLSGRRLQRGSMLGFDTEVTKHTEIAEKEWLQSRPADKVNSVVLNDRLRRLVV